MEINDFLQINDFIYQIYTEPSLEQCKQLFLRRLKLLIPYSYASFMTAVEENGQVRLTDPVCNPPSFEQAELLYEQALGDEDIDHTNWILYSAQSELIRESEIMNAASRLASPIYKQCYSKYNIYDTIQMTIVYEHKIYGSLTLYRTKEDGAFQENDTIYLKALGRHLNYIFYRRLSGRTLEAAESALQSCIDEKGLTRRESEIFRLIIHGQDNDEILEQIPITEHTLKKHLQNIYRKCGVSSRLELLKAVRF